MDSNSFFSPLPPILCTDSFWVCVLSFVQFALKVSMWFSGIFATFMLIYAGILYNQQPEKAKEIHQRIIWSIVGFVIALISFSLIVFIENIIQSRSSLDNNFLIKFVLAQELPITTPPRSINCGGVEIYSSLERTSDLEEDAWKVCLFYLIQELLRGFYWLALLSAVFYLIWTGYNYIYHPEKSKDLHKNILFIIIGTVIAILSFSIVKLIDLFFRNF